MITKTVKYQEMLSVLCIKGLHDKTPEPYSGQSELRLTIPFEEFVKLCLELKNYGEYILSEPSSKLDELAKIYRTSKSIEDELRSIYRKEVAYAILREIHYSQRYGKGITRINVSKEIQGMEMDYTAIIGVADALARPAIDAITYVGSCEYPVNSNLLGKHTHEAYCLALTLSTLSDSPVQYKYI